MTSAFLAIFRSAARPSLDFRLSVMLRLLRCKFWKSEPSRGPPGPSPACASGGISILMTLAPQSASWRTQVGPDRTRVRSRTVKRERAVEALGLGISDASHATDFLVERSRIGPGWIAGCGEKCQQTQGAGELDGLPFSNITVARILTGALPLLMPWWILPDSIRKASPTL